MTEMLTTYENWALQLFFNTLRKWFLHTFSAFLVEVIRAVFDTAFYHASYLRAHSELTSFLALYALMHSCDTILASDQVLSTIVFVTYCRYLHSHNVYACLMVVFLTIANAFDDSSRFLTSATNFSMRLRNRGDLDAAHLLLSLKELILFYRLLGIWVRLRQCLRVAF